MDLASSVDAEASDFRTVREPFHSCHHIPVHVHAGRDRLDLAIEERFVADLDADVETKRDLVLEHVRKLKDPAYNLKIGAAGREAVMKACDWSVNSIRFRDLIEAVRRS